MDSRRIPLLERWGCLRREQIFSLARQAWLSPECHRGRGENAVNCMWIFSGGRTKNVKKQLDRLTQKSGLFYKGEVGKVWLIVPTSAVIAFIRR